MSPAYGTVIDTSDGPFGLVVDHGAVVAAGWTADQARLAGLIPPEQRPEHIEWIGEADAAFVGGVLAWAVGAVHRYYRGYHAAPGEVPVRQAGTPFLMQAWAAMRGIEAGNVATYGELAAMAGHPTAARAAGRACSHNAVALFVPCHRVIPSDGGVGEFGYGRALKKALLVRERA
ncbi:MAG: methylated-DNA--[protein]-cysteine S-methyltransferase [Bifidobacteriaceae bacterium]|jgi:methylated-DNA-[protein]-cysteine S-methyltransferase|nr:methylated-DNA--[protein]-cysteine S-methyltransferase [Bifidobacteriaceae bacterium]